MELPVGIAQRIEAEREQGHVRPTGAENVAVDNVQRPPSSTPQLRELPSLPRAVNAESGRPGGAGVTNRAVPRPTVQAVAHQIIQAAVARQVILAPAAAPTPQAAPAHPQAAPTVSGQAPASWPPLTPPPPYFISKTPAFSVLAQSTLGDAGSAADGFDDAMKLVSAAADAAGGALDGVSTAALELDGVLSEFPAAADDLDNMLSIGRDMWDASEGGLSGLLTAAPPAGVLQSLGQAAQSAAGAGGGLGGGATVIFIPATTMPTTSSALLPGAVGATVAGVLGVVIPVATAFLLFNQLFGSSWAAQMAQFTQQELALFQKNPLGFTLYWLNQQIAAMQQQLAGGLIPGQAQQNQVRNAIARLQQEAITIQTLQLVPGSAVGPI